MQTAQVKAALRRHYKPQEYALMFEVGNATGSNVRRHADAVVMNLWPSRGLLIEGIEIKVSRSDWRREIENPAKAEEIAKFCDRWWVVTPPGIVQEHELPFNWGHIVVNEKGTLSVKKQAPKLEPVALTRGFVAAMLRRASDVDAKEIEVMVAKAVVEREGKMAEMIEREVAKRTRQFASIQDKIDELKAAGLDLTGWQTADEILKAYKLGKSLRDSYAMSGLKHKADALRGVADTLTAVHETLFAEERVQ